MTKTEQNRAKKEASRRGQVKVLVRLFNPIVGRTTWMTKWVSAEAVTYFGGVR
jgi:hypothetical protein